MDIRAALTELEKKNVFIKYSYDYYDNGVNLNFSIEFRGWGTDFQTGWYGDNHEFGDVGRTLEKSVIIATELSNEKETLEAYFSIVHNSSIDPESPWIKRQLASQKIQNIVYKNVTKEWEEFGKKFMKDEEN